MRRSSCKCPRLARGIAAILLAGGAGPGLAQEAGGDVAEQLETQVRKIEILQRELDAQRAALDELRRTVRLEARGRGNAPAQAGNGQAASMQVAAPRKPAAGGVGPIAQAEDGRPVGQAPAARERPPEVAPIFEQPGVLTKPGTTIFEPSLQYQYSSSDKIALVGYTIIPAIIIGLIDVRNVKSNSLTGTLSFRRGITNRFELEARLPYVYRWDDVRGREIADPERVRSVFFKEDANDIGDVELIGRYQLNEGGGDSPYYIASLRFKTRTGKDPFEVATSLSVENARTGNVNELPTGSGFYSLTPGLTVLIPSDPAVFFGGISYQYSFKRSGVTPNLVNVSDPGNYAYDEIQPGGVLGFNFGMGLALNERSSFSIGYDHLSVGKTDATFRYDGSKAEGVRVQLGSLLLGYSYRLNDKRTLNLSVGVGVTRDTPDVQLTLRVPITL